MIGCPLTIDAASKDGYTLITVEGAVDTSNVEEFRSILMPKCEEAGSKIILDCANVTYMNSRSFALLYRFHYICESNGGRFAICCIPSKIQNIIRLLGLDVLLKIYTSLEEAQAALAEEGEVTS